MDSKIERLLNKKQGLSFDEYKEEVEYQLQDDEGILVLSKKDEVIQDNFLEALGIAAEKIGMTSEKEKENESKE